MAPQNAPTKSHDQKVTVSRAYSCARMTYSTIAVTKGLHTVEKIRAKSTKTRRLRKGIGRCSDFCCTEVL
jgi:hypothetical protein